MLTVLMATYNGAGTLPRVLNAYCKLNPPQGGWKLTIVDNGSTDNTKEIVSSFHSLLPLTYVFEPNLGKSTALNTGFLTISGDLVVMTDDDALPKPDWLVQMRLAADSQPDFSVFGGSIIPHWDVPPEEWILTWQTPVLTITDPAWEEGPIVIASISGPNMAVRSEVIEAGFRFDASLGPIGPRYQMGEEADFLQRLGKAGLKAWYCKRAVVEHIIERAQMKKEWVLRRAYPLGRAHYRWDYIQYSPARPTLLLGIPRYMIREVLVQAVNVAHAELTHNRDKAFKERWQLHYLIGRAAEGRRIFGENSVA